MAVMREEPDLSLQIPGPVCLSPTLGKDGWALGLGWGDGCWCSRHYHAGTEQAMRRSAEHSLCPRCPAGTALLSVHPLPRAEGPGSSSILAEAQRS